MDRVDSGSGTRPLQTPSNHPVVTEEAYLKGRDKASPLSPLQSINMKALLIQINKFFQIYPGAYYGVSSGYRPVVINAATKGAATYSAHFTCEAIDLRDPDKRLANWCQDHLDVLEQLQLFMESPKATPNWVHLQTRRPGSGNRIFIP